MEPDVERNGIERHGIFLEDRMDPDFGLLDKLYEKSALNKSERQAIEASTTTNKKNKMLLNLVLEKNIVERLMDALKDTGQNHLVNYIRADGNYIPELFRDVWPLLEHETDILRVNRGSLIDLLDTDELCNEMFSRKVLNRRQIDHISESRSNAKKNECLLDMMERFSVWQYKRTIECLQDTKQSHIAEILSEGGVVVQVHANLGNEEEEAIAAEFTRRIGNRSTEECNRILELTHQKLIDMRFESGQSIVLYFHCKTQYGLEHLRDLFTSNRLSSNVGEVFRHLRSQKETVAGSFDLLNRLKLSWPKDDYEKSFNYFSKKLNHLPLELLDMILLKASLVFMLTGNQLIDERTDADIICAFASVDECWSKRILRTRFKKRILRNVARRYENVRSQAAFVRKNRIFLMEKIKPKDLINRMRSVDCLTDKETRLINARQAAYDGEINEELLNVMTSFNAKRYNGFIYCLMETHQESVVHVVESGREGLQKYRENQISKSATKRNEENLMRRRIRGIAILSDELFVLSDYSTEVKVYDLTDLSLKRSLMLKDFTSLSDIGSSERHGCLYIISKKSRFESKVILNVDREGHLKAEWSVGVSLIESLSVSNEFNVILTDNTRNMIIEYSPDGQLIREIQLSSASVTGPRHAIKLASGHFVVSHGSVADRLHRVCIVDVDGNILKSFGGERGSGEERMNCPVHLVSDREGFIMVADEWNSRVLLLSPDLEFKREILSKEEHGLRHPTRIHLDQSNGRMFVVDNDYDFEKTLLKDGRILCFNIHENTKQLRELRGSLDTRDDDRILIQSPKTIKEEDTMPRYIPGITVLDGELFVIHEKSRDLEVYDSRTLSMVRSLKLTELFNPFDIGSSKSYRCLFIVDDKYRGDSSEILSVDPAGKIINRWLTGEKNCGRLSVTDDDDSNVVLTFFRENKLIEYSRDGQLIREIILSYPAISDPCHSMKLTDGHFLVCHAALSPDGGQYYRVSIVDQRGAVIKSFGERGGYADRLCLRGPCHMTVDEDGSILIADSLNGRVLLLSSTLEFKREILLKEENELSRPTAIHLDRLNGRLFVVDNEWDEVKRRYLDGKVFAFDIQYKGGIVV